MSDDRPPEGHPVLRGLALWAVAAGVIVLAAAAFMLSYPGIHAVALQAGVSRPLARVYPVIFDAMLAIACAAVLSLRGAGLISRFYAWLSLLVLLAAAAGADTLHSIRIRPPHREAAAAAAIIPWALLLIGFGLLLAMLRHARLRRAAAARTETQVRAEPPRPAPVMAALPAGTTASAQPWDHQQERAIPGLPPADISGPPAEQPRPADGAESGSDPQHAEQVNRPAVTANHGPAEPEQQASKPTAGANHGPADHDPADAQATSTHAAEPRPNRPAPIKAAPAEPRPSGTAPIKAAPAEAEATLLAAPAEPLVPHPRPDDPAIADRPVTTAPFHRMWSTPTPPDDDEP